MAKVLISIDDELLRRIDERAKQLGLTRSAFVARVAATELGADRIDPARRRSIHRAQEVCRAAVKTADATDLVRQMRDER